MTNIVDLSYDQMAQDCTVLAENITKKFPDIKRLVAITRGGLFPTLVLSHLLQIKDIECIALESYDSGVNAQNFEVKLQQNIEKHLPDDPCTLFVDDLFDSGNTLKFVKNLYPKAKRCTLYLKDKDNKDNLDALDVYGKLIDDNWIRFQYEVD